MLYESLVCGHRAIASDTSDLACFVIEQEALMASADLETLMSFVDKLMQNLSDNFTEIYSFQGKEVYWIQWSSHTVCPNCNTEVFLSPFNTVGSGIYACQSCNSNFRPVRVNADSIKPMEICCMANGSIRNGKSTAQARLSSDSRSLEKYYNDLCGALCAIGLEDALQPKTVIPDCNLQRESALHKKGSSISNSLFPKLHVG